MTLGYPKQLAIVLVRAVSGFFRALQWRSCRFHPSCSEYAVEAFKHLNFFKAFGVMCFRVLRCHPFSAGGHDPLIFKKKDR